MAVFELVLVVSALFCALVAGFVFAFSSVVMPGIQSFGDRDFLRAFKAIDGVIQRSQTSFLVVWIGSIVLLATSLLLGFWYVSGMDLFLLILSAAIYFLGVQIPTVRINVPLNNMLQELDLDSLDESQIEQTRTRFEIRWIKWNHIRTVLATISSALLILLLLKL
jgi:uncharacterized membrane protein